MQTGRRLSELSQLRLDDIELPVKIVRPVLATTSRSVGLVREQMDQRLQENAL